MDQAEFDGKRRTARIAGLWYFAMLVTGLWGMMYAPSEIIVSGNAAETAANLARYGLLFRTGILANLACQMAFVFLALSLRDLLAGIDAKLARMMAALVIAAVPVAFLNEIFSVAAALALDGSPYLEAFGKERIEALALFFLDLHGQGIFVSGFFWGLWLFPFGFLVIRSGFIPGIIGVLLVIGGFAYVIDSATAILFPAAKKAVGDALLLPLALGEFSAIGWLLAKGVRRMPVPAASAAGAGAAAGLRS